MLDDFAEIVVGLRSRRTVAVIVVGHCNRITETHELLLHIENVRIDTVSLGTDDDAGMRPFAFGDRNDRCGTGLSRLSHKNTPALL